MSKDLTPNSSWAEAAARLLDPVHFMERRAAEADEYVRILKGQQVMGGVDHMYEIRDAVLDWEHSARCYREGAVALRASRHIRSDRVQHFKGGFYRVLSWDATDEGTGARLVWYVSEADGRLWSRTYEAFTETVVWPDGVSGPRFLRVAL